jgi:hypothetical protein
VTEAYPLAWPPGWPRTSMSRRCASRFGRNTYNQIIQLQNELRRLGATNVTISSNVPVRQDGLPYADAAKRRYDDPGVAIYFKLRGKALSMARDRYWTPWENMRSLVLAIDAMRSIERHGGSTMMERAFDGFAALPPPDDCWKILGISTGGYERRLIPDEIRAAFRNKVREHHGKDYDMARLVRARDEALEKIG